MHDQQTLQGSTKNIGGSEFACVRADFAAFRPSGLKSSSYTRADSSEAKTHHGLDSKNKHGFPNCFGTGCPNWVLR
eukprot:scaffold3292_cov120-Cylindrotheca_fusiformis.AAC.5